MSKTIEISRELLSHAAAILSSVHSDVAHQLTALLAAPVVERKEPVMKLEAERLWNGAGEYAVSFVKAGWLEECRKAGGTFMLYTSPPAPVAVDAEMVTLFRDILGWADSNTTWSEIEYRIRACLDKVKELNK